MNTTTIIAIYFLIWWLTLFAVLPFGVKSQSESGAEIEAGHRSGRAGGACGVAQVSLDDAGRQHHLRHSVCLLCERSAADRIPQTDIDAAASVSAMLRR